MPSAMYATERDWLTYEMDVAQANGLPIVALEPFGGRDADRDKAVGGECLYFLPEHGGADSGGVDDLGKAAAQFAGGQCF